MGWVDQVPQADLTSLVEATRAIGADPGLVLHGGGNSSLKTTYRDLAGAEIPVILVKGSGHDMGSIGGEGFAPLRLETLRRLLPPVRVPDDAVENELRCALVDASAPDPSVETLLHVLLPAPAVLHSHADAILALTDSVQGPGLLREALGARCLFADYAMPGPDLVAACAQAWAAGGPTVEGIVLLQHGLFTFGETPAEALRRHLEIVGVAEGLLTIDGGSRTASEDPGLTSTFVSAPQDDQKSVDPAALAGVRKELCELAGKPLIVQRTWDDAIAGFVSDPALLEAAERGPLTPDHVVYVKPWPAVAGGCRTSSEDPGPRSAFASRSQDDGEVKAADCGTVMIASTAVSASQDDAESVGGCRTSSGIPGSASRPRNDEMMIKGYAEARPPSSSWGAETNVEVSPGSSHEVRSPTASPSVGQAGLAAYADEYRHYFAANQDRRGIALTMLDPAPRVVLDGRFGLLTAGPTISHARAAADIAQHTMKAIRQAEALGGYRPADPSHVFDLEYWSYQLRKTARKANSLPLAGQVAVVTGAASGIGKGCAGALLELGACVVGWDLSPKVTEVFDRPEYLGLQVDVTDAAQMAAALAKGVEAFGGVDILTVAAGIFPTSANLGELKAEAWRKTMAVNVDSVMELYGLVLPLLEQAVPYGRVVLIASKNFVAPGPGAAAYSSSKAAVTQLTRVAALEWAGKGIRVNMLHPDAVFDTGLWTPELLAARAEHYGMSVDEYKRRNLLHAEITSGQVGRLAALTCLEPFASTTGAQIPIDGGSDRVI